MKKILQLIVLSMMLPLIGMAEPSWRVVATPREWPHQADGSNALVRSVLTVEAEVAKAQHFLASEKYHIIQGGLKGDSPHVVVQYPDEPNSKWTIFYNPKDKSIGQIVKRGSNAYRIMLGDAKHYASFEGEYLEWGGDGILKFFARTIRDQIKHQVKWRDNGNIDEENIYNWENRGRVISGWTVSNTPIYGTKGSSGK